jgi:hypothetical protein
LNHFSKNVSSSSQKSTVQVKDNLCEDIITNLAKLTLTEKQLGPEWKQSLAGIIGLISCSNDNIFAQVSNYVLCARTDVDSDAIKLKMLNLFLKTTLSLKAKGHKDK